MSDKPFQRIDSESNTAVGRDFERIARDFFESKHRIKLTPSYQVRVGIGVRTKVRRFDLDCEEPATLIECKSHTWTVGGNMLSAKMTVWNESMLYFHLAPNAFRKILFVLRSVRREQTLAEYYLHTHGHLVPEGVQIWEYDQFAHDARQVC